MIEKEEANGRSAFLIFPPSSRKPLLLGFSPVGYFLPSRYKRSNIFDRLRGRSKDIGFLLGAIVKSIPSYTGVFKFSRGSPSLAKLSWNLSRVSLGNSWIGGVSRLLPHTHTTPFRYGYDINSLYPFCSLNLLPDKFLGLDLSPSLPNLFGFIQANVTFKLGNNTLLWGEGLFFSEEVKFLKKMGASVSTGYAMQFSSAINSNEDFIFTLFNRRKREKESLKLSKDLMNFWYGRLSFNTSPKSLCSNRRAWAQAIISYARITMVPFQLGKYGKCSHFNVDSIFLSQPLPPHLLGNKIGQWRNILRDGKWKPTNDRLYSIKSLT
uniref:Putative DNA polymerase type B n=1 Tax=Carybdea alata TaxID=1193083 RepID=G9IC02_CARAL|nr:putative DNA polymerase type B [Alatina alata]